VTCGRNIGSPAVAAIARCGLNAGGSAEIAVTGSID
jgi:hypothetical protein